MARRKQLVRIPGADIEKFVVYTTGFSFGVYCKCGGFSGFLELSKHCLLCNREYPADMPMKEASVLQASYRWEN